MKIIASVDGWMGKIVDCDRCGCQFIIEQVDKKKIIKQPVVRSVMPNMNKKVFAFDYVIKCPCGCTIWIGRKHLKTERNLNYAERALYR
jgi:hypothetical protein